MEAGSRPGWVLLVDEDQAFTDAAVDALRSQGISAQAVPDAQLALRTLAAHEPTVLILAAELPNDAAAWLLRRLRDDYMGRRPWVVLAASPEYVHADTASLGVDVVMLKPAGTEAILGVVRDTARIHGPSDPTRMRELLKASLLGGSLESALGVAAWQVAQGFGVQDCLLLGSLGESFYVGNARGPVNDAPDAPVWERCQSSLETGVPVVATADGEGVTTTLAVPIDLPIGLRQGVLMVRDEGVLLWSPDMRESLLAVSARLSAELAWRSVHERIVDENAHLREISMHDPLLTGVLTRTTFDHNLAGEVLARQRRGETVHLTVLDVRGLKHINERHGHLAGDAMLHHVATLVRQTVRTHDLVARYAGDALVILMSVLTQPEARRVVERLQERIAQTPLVHEELTLPVETVAGLASIAVDNEAAPEAALGRAAAAARAAKRRREPLVVAEAALSDEGNDAALTALRSLDAGAILGGMYQIVHEISRGAMGVVYRAEDLGLRRAVAVKTLRPDLGNDQKFVERFRAEAATLAALRHENLVQVYAFGSDAGEVYFVMELVEGESLEDRFERSREQGPLIPLDLVTRILSEIAAALDAMHNAGIFHRDVKPANILLDRRHERAVLVDVGIAKARGGAADQAGTPGFMAPEIIRGGSESAVSDVYGLASTAYMLVSAAAPFGETGIEEILYRQCEGPPPPASTHRPGLPAAVDQVLAQSLDPEPAVRHTSASGFVRALAAAFAEVRPEALADLDAVRKGSRPAAPKAPLGATVNLGDSQIDLPERAKVSPSARTELAAPLPVDPAPVPAPAPVTPAPASRAAPRIGTRFPGAPRPDETPQSRGLWFRGAHRLLGPRHSPTFVREAAKRYPALAETVAPQTSLVSWHPTGLLSAMLQEIAASGRDAHDFAHELGRLSGAETLAHFLGADPAAMSLREVVEATPTIWHCYHTWGKVKVAWQDRGVSLTVENGPVDPLVCAASTGLLERIATLGGALHPSTEEASCQSRGAPACVFSIRWEGERVR